MNTTKISVPFLEQDYELEHRWSEARATDWMIKQGWIVGCNYCPSNAVNQIEMWQEETYDPQQIDKELGWAASLGFNSVRVFLHHLVWEKDGKAYLERIDNFLSIADRHGIRAMLVFFDAVWNPFPQLGTQPTPKNNVHNSGWVQCPGFDILNTPSRHDSLKGYVESIVRRFQKDKRVLIWDLFNEPDNMNLASYKDDDYDFHKAELSMALLKKTIRWVRDINPDQPITMAPWKDDWSCTSKLAALDNYMFSHSDIISFHWYENRDSMKERILHLKRYNRPLMCTEYMARPFGNTFQEILPLFKEHNVAAYNWGLVAGKTQTHCPWDSWNKSYTEEPELWFHDIFREDGTPYKQDEVEFIRSITETEEKVKAA